MGLLGNTTAIGPGLSQRTGLMGTLDNWGRSPGDPGYGSSTPPGTARVSSPTDDGGRSSTNILDPNLPASYLSDPGVAAARTQAGVNADPATQQAQLNAMPRVRLGSGGPIGGLNAIYGNGPSVQQAATAQVNATGGPTGSSNAATKAEARGVDPRTATGGGSGTGGSAGSGGTGDFTNPANYGWGHFSPGAQDTAGYYSDLAKYQQQAPSAQLQRTGVDWSGMGSGQQAPPTTPASGSTPMGAPPLPPSMGFTQDSVARAAAAPVSYPQDTLVSSPPPPAPASGSPGGSPSLSDGRQLFGVTQANGAPMTPYSNPNANLPTSNLGPIVSPNATFGAPPAASTSSGAQTGMVSRIGTNPGAQAQVSGMAAFGSPLSGTGTPTPNRPVSNIGTAGGGAQGTLDNRAPPTSGGVQGMPAMGPGGIPAVGQFSNPVFQQGQQSRNEQTAVEQRTSDPNAYNTADKAAADASRGVQTAALSDAANPNNFNTADKAKADASRNVQTGALSDVASPNAYATPTTADANQSRGEQQSLVSRLNSDLNGGAPSAAQAQLRQATDQNIQSQAAIAASAGPGSANMAARTAATNTANANQTAAGQSAILKAQEYQQARGELGTATMGARTADINTVGQEYGKTTAQLGLEQSGANALRSSDLASRGQTDQNTIAQLGLEQSGANALRSSDLASNAQTSTNITNQNALMAQQARDKRAQDLTATGMSYDNAMKQAQLEEDQNKAQLSADVSQHQIDTTASGQYYGLAQATNANDLASRMHYEDLMAQKYANDAGLAQSASQFNTQQGNLMTGTYLSAAAAGLGMLSDETKKTDIAPASAKETSEFLGKLRPSVFRYKDEKFGKGKHVGFMAQDAEKSSLGKKLVRETPVGKVLEVPKLLSVYGAALAHMEQRMRKVEGKKKPATPAGKQTFGARKAA